MGRDEELERSVGPMSIFADQLLDRVQGKLSQVAMEEQHSGGPISPPFQIMAIENDVTPYVIEVDDKEPEAKNPEVSKASVSISPAKKSPKKIKQVPSPVVSPKVVPNVSPKVRNVSPKVVPNVSPKVVPNVSPKVVPNVSPKVRNVSPKAVPNVSPKFRNVSPKFPNSPDDVVLGETPKDFWVEEDCEQCQTFGEILFKNPSEWKSETYDEVSDLMKFLEKSGESNLIRMWLTVRVLQSLLSSVTFDIEVVSELLQSFFSGFFFFFLDVF